MFFWLSRMYIHGAYYSNYQSWCKDPYIVRPSSHLVWSIVGQESLNGYTSSFCMTPSCESVYTGIEITSGLFQVWHSSDIYSLRELEGGCMMTLISTMASIDLSIYLSNRVGVTSRRPIVNYTHLLMILGSSSLSWYAHQSHIAIPSFCKTRLSDVCSRAIDLYLDKSNMMNLGSSYGIWVRIGIEMVHHVLIGIVCLYVAQLSTLNIEVYKVKDIDLIQYSLQGWHVQLSISLGMIGSLSIASGHSISISTYPYLYSCYSRSVSVFSHHMWIGGVLIVGSSAHSSIQVMKECDSSLTMILQHRHVILTHLIWLNIFLRVHSLSIYLHNDTYKGLGRTEDIFSDSCIRLYPYLLIVSVVNMKSGYTSEYNRIQHDIGRGEVMVNHIHSFSLHLTVLIILKGILTGRGSRLISDKLDLGFQYPCDGPARGGTCQVSPWDHLFLALFWMYNLISVLIFHYFWKMQSDIWCLSLTSNRDIGSRTTYLT